MTAKKRTAATILATALAAILQVATPNPAAATDAESQPTTATIQEGTPFYDSLMPYAIKWKDAVMAKDAHALADISPPYEKKEIMDAIPDEKSPLYRGLYDNDAYAAQTPPALSPYQILKSAKKLKIVLVSEKPVYQRGATAYYYDEDRSSSSPPAGSIDHETQKWAISCHFQWSGMKWYADFVDQYSMPMEDDTQ